VSKGKLEKFKEMSTFPNVLQPPFEDVFKQNFRLKGKWSNDFFGNHHPITVELGCGKGEYTVGLAKKFPGSNFIGIDIKGARIWKGAKAALNENISNTGFLRTRIDFIESFFAENEIREIWITFPDPQLKKSLKRLTSTRFLKRYQNFLVDGGLIHLKTDNPELYHYTKALAEFNGLPIEFATEDLYHSGSTDEILSIRTFYESMWIEAGLPIHYLKFRLYTKTPLNEPPDE
jgi:tRNA (guanine-N7-)-methyltransferase